MTSSVTRASNRKSTVGRRKRLLSRLKGCSQRKEFTRFTRGLRFKLNVISFGSVHFFNVDHWEIFCSSCTIHVCITCRLCAINQSSGCSDKRWRRVTHRATTATVSTKQLAIQTPTSVRSRHHQTNRTPPPPPTLLRLSIATAVSRRGSSSICRPSSRFNTIMLKSTIQLHVHHNFRCLNVITNSQVLQFESFFEQLCFAVVAV